MRVRMNANIREWVGDRKIVCEKNKKEGKSESESEREKERERERERVRKWMR